MEHGDTLEFDPASLPPGARVGAWRVLGWRGRGTYGTVYRAVRQGQEQDGPVALKLALRSRDERFAREAQLLSRLQHPSVPRLLDFGHWIHPSGSPYPFLVMEWVEGLPLYEWASRRNPSSRQVLGVLTQVARALAATHDGGGVHRDVKGDNILVRWADDHALLTDFGAGHYTGADTLTGPGLPPGTPPYRSPEAWAFARHHAGHPTARYAARAADDVFALGVSAYRLVTGEYPGPAGEAGGVRPPWELNPRVGPRLGALILRMLSAQPEARGTAHELAEAMEEATRREGPEEAAQPLLTEAHRQRQVWPSEELIAAPVREQRHRWHLAAHDARRWWAVAGRRWLRTAAVGVPLALGAGWAVHVWIEERPSPARRTEDARARQDDTAAVGDTTLTTPAPAPRAPSGREGIGLDLPQKPLPGQLRPDATGKCPGKGRVAINGGCWLELKASANDCDANDYVYKGGCYVPAFPPGRAPTSSPVKAHDLEP